VYEPYGPPRPVTRIALLSCRERNIKFTVSNYKMRRAESITTCLPNLIIVDLLVIQKITPDLLRKISQV
jgi:hypothetical protein